MACFNTCKKAILDTKHPQSRLGRHTRRVHVPFFDPTSMERILKRNLRPKEVCVGEAYGGVGTVVKGFVEIIRSYLVIRGSGNSQKRGYIRFGLRATGG